MIANYPVQPLSTSYEDSRPQIETASNIASLQNLDEAGSAPISLYKALSNGLMMALIDEPTFTRLYPDSTVQDINIAVHGTGMPGLRQDSNGNWQDIASECTTPSDRREYVRRRLLVNAAKKLLRCLGPNAIRSIITTRPERLPDALHLKDICIEVCQRYDPAFLAAL